MNVYSESTLLNLVLNSSNVSGSLINSASEILNGSSFIKSALGNFNFAS
jgi:hypothetical protein